MSLLLLFRSGGGAVVTQALSATVKSNSALWDSGTTTWDGGTTTWDSATNMGAIRIFGVVFNRISGVVASLTASFISGGTTYNQALNAQLTVAVSAFKAISKALTATVLDTGALARGFLRSLSDTVSGTASLTAIRVYLRDLTDTVAILRSTVFSISKQLSVVVGTVDTLTAVKTAFRTLTATVVDTATLLAARVNLRTLADTVASTATLRRDIAKIMVYAATTIAEITKGLQVRLTKAVTTSATIIRSLAELGAVLSGIAVFTAIKIKSVYTAAVQLVVRDKAGRTTSYTKRR